MINNKPTKRTSRQNRSLHLMFSQLADELNEAGFDMKRTLKPEIEIAWNEYMVKEYLWRPLQKAMLGKQSTTELTTKEIDKVFDNLARHLNQKLGLELFFPSVETLMMEERIKMKGKNDTITTQNS